MLAVNYHRDHTALTSAPLFHSGGLCVMTLPILMAGGHVILHESFDAAHAPEDVQKYSVTSLFLVPTMMLYLTQLSEFRTADVSSIEIIIAGAAPVPEHLLRIFGSRDIPVSQCWGLTETATGATFLGTEHALDKLGSCGTAGMLNEVKLIDFDGNTCPPRTFRESCVSAETPLRQGIGITLMRRRLPTWRMAGSVREMSRIKMRTGFSISATVTGGFLHPDIRMSSPPHIEAPGAHK